VSEYTNVSYSSLRSINRLFMRAFRAPLKSVKWDLIAKTSKWFLDSMAPDGEAIDYGDSWSKRGWGSLDPINVLFWEELIGVKAQLSVPVDACKAADYFANKWYAVGLDNPWDLETYWARDWSAITAQCPRTSRAFGSVLRTFFPKGGMGLLRTYLTGATTQAKLAGSGRFAQADQSFLSVSAVPNTNPHRELDFGGLIWSAFGNRLLADWGYGDIASTKSSSGEVSLYDTTENMDFVASGANTLVVPDARDDGEAGTDMSQIKGYAGKITAVAVSGYGGFRLDGSLPYGSTDEDGWMKYFDRWTFAIGGGHYMVIDSFALKDSRPASKVYENWMARSVAPIITSVSPSTAAKAGGTVISIVGDNFAGLTGKSVLINGVACVKYAVVTNQLLRCVVPPSSVTGTAKITLVVNGAKTEDSARLKYGAVAATGSFILPTASPCDARDIANVSVGLSGTNAVLLRPSCSMLANQASESIGRIAGTSLRGGRFYLQSGVESLINRTNNLEQRKIFRFVPNVAVRNDIRVFTLVSGTSEAKLPASSVVKVSCSGKVCFDVIVGAKKRRLTLTPVGGRYEISSFY
jgi:hypothetical protein